MREERKIEHKTALKTGQDLLDEVVACLQDALDATEAFGGVTVALQVELRDLDGRPVALFMNDHDVRLRVLTSRAWEAK